MKVLGADILSEVTEKTSRNLKATAAIVVAVKLFNVQIQELRVFDVKPASPLYSTWYPSH